VQPYHDKSRNKDHGPMCDILRHTVFILINFG